MRRLLLSLSLLLPATAAFAQPGTTTRAQVTDYPVSAVSKTVAIGAEYMVRSFGQHNRMFTTDSYLVVEVAVFPVKGEQVKISLDRFELLVNGKDKRSAQIPQMVAASLRYNNWEGERGLQAQVGPVILGRREDSRFPGDRGPDGTYPRPAPAPAPRPEHETVVEHAPYRADEAALEFAIVEGPVTGPISGYVYFAYKGKASKIRSLQLIFNGEEIGRLTLKLL